MVICIYVYVYVCDVCVYVCYVCVYVCDVCVCKCVCHSIEVTDGVVVSYGVFEFRLLHEEDMSYVQLPHLYTYILTYQ